MPYFPLGPSINDVTLGRGEGGCQKCDDSTTDRLHDWTVTRVSGYKNVKHLRDSIYGWSLWSAAAIKCISFFFAQIPAHVLSKAHSALSKKYADGSSPNVMDRAVFLRFSCLLQNLQSYLAFSQQGKTM